MPLIPAVKAVRQRRYLEGCRQFVHEGMDTLVNPSRLLDLAKAAPAAPKLWQAT
jgi:hypothetical protein